MPKRAWQARRFDRPEEVKRHGRTVATTRATDVPPGRVVRAARARRGPRQARPADTRSWGGHRVLIAGPWPRGAMTAAKDE